MEDAKRVKAIESVINHDVKSVEYFIKEQSCIPDNLKIYVHFGLTSQDISTSAIMLGVKGAIDNIITPFIEKIQTKLYNMATKSYRDIIMLSRTHGQPASPTFLGKEIFVFVERLNDQLKTLYGTTFTTKFGGAVGNFNAHYAAFPNGNWPALADNFIAELGLERSKYTTQIDHYDNLAALFDNIRRINNILIDFAKDMWLYISYEYFIQKINENEVGSSTMPHKVNPINFENAEGNLLIANSLLSFLSNKLPISRLQRDLTDSTITRNIGVSLAHSLIGYKSLLVGMSKILPNERKIKQDLDANPVVIIEGMQTILKREGVENAYEIFKKFSRKNIKLTLKDIKAFIEELHEANVITGVVRDELLALSPYNYTGKCPGLVIK